MLRWVAARAVVVLVGLAVAVLLGEIGIRLASPIQPEHLLPLPYRHEDLQRVVTGDAYLRFDPLLGWSPTPATAREDRGVLYRTNAAGLRADREYALEPSPGVRRLAAFGDSFTHCDEVAYADCWTSDLERTWPGTEVLNFGAPGYGHDQAWLRYQREGQAYRPCAVLIGYQVENINRVVNRFRPFYVPQGGYVLSKPRFLLDGEGLQLLPNPATTPEPLADPRWVEATLGPHDAYYFPGTFVANPLDVLQLARVVRTAAYRHHAGERGFTARQVQDLAWAYREDQEAYRLTGRLLVHFARQVRQDGATPVVVVFGRPREVTTVRGGGDKVYAPLLDWLAREGVPTIDVTDRLAREALRINVSALFRPEGHYSPGGNQVVAALLARRLPELVGGTCGAG